MTAPMRPSAIDKGSETICALATAHGIGAISIVRISGARAGEITRKIAAFLPKELESHKIYYGFLKRLDGDQPVDEVLVSYFAEGRSFTGETSFEISCHGSQILVDEILRNLCEAGARPAERGEFTARAFMNGRIDLVQAESVLALIESRSPRAAQVALRQLQGDFSQALKRIADGLTWTIAHLEAGIDFASEDIVFTPPGELAKQVEGLLRLVGEILKSYRQGLILRDGFRVALAGQPNVGKSSLLNALAGAERAIVTPIAGTTRDFIEVELSMEGAQVTLIDTAGLRASTDAIEQIGVARTVARLSDVDLVLYVVDATESLVENEYFAAIPWGKTAVVVNKIDLVADRIASTYDHALAVLPVSATTGQGLSELRQWLGGRVRAELAEDCAVVSNARQFNGLQRAQESLEKAVPLMHMEESPDLIALELQTALQALYGVLGLVFDDQVMDRVFREFCLGK